MTPPATLPATPNSSGTLRVSLDVSAVPINPAGAGRYTIELTRALARRDDVELVLISRDNDSKRWECEYELLDRAPSLRPIRLVWEQTMMPRLIRSSGAVVHHGPHYTMPIRSQIPNVVTIHDCTFFDHPEWHERTKVVFFRRAISVAARKADAIVCVSKHTADRLSQLCDVRAPVIVAPHGLDHLRFTQFEPEAGSDANELNKLGLEASSPLIVFVGTLEPRKGITTLLEAFRLIAGKHREAQLVLAGQMGWGMDETAHSIENGPYKERIIHVGYVREAAVPALLRSAQVVVYPALEEGFGLPALEAMACGARLITTEGTVMAEAARGVADLAPPGDVHALADLIDTALVEGVHAKRNEELRAKGIAIASESTWEASAALHRSAYQRALGS